MFDPQWDYTKERLTERYMERQKPEPFNPGSVGYWIDGREVAAIICAWCFTEMGFKEGSGETHGICDKCREREERK